MSESEGKERRALTLREMDAPKEAYGGPGTKESTLRARATAHFEEMTDEQNAGWPGRSAVRWMFGRMPLLAVPVLGLMVLKLAGLPWSVAVGGAGLFLDIVGVWLLAQGLLVSDEDAAWRSTWDSMGHQHLLAQRDRRQATFAL